MTETERNAVIEACARVCESRGRELIMDGENEGGSYYWEQRAIGDALYRAAWAIRSLIPPDAAALPHQQPPSEDE